MIVIPLASPSSTDEAKSTYGTDQAWRCAPGPTASAVEVAAAGAAAAAAGAPEVVAVAAAGVRVFSSAQSSRKPSMARPAKSSRPMPTRKTFLSETKSHVSPCRTKSVMVSTGPRTEAHKYSTNEII